MKKLLMSIAVVAFLIACGGSDSSDANGNKPSSTSGTKNGVSNNTQNEVNNNTQNGTKDENTPCGKPVADDGSEPKPLPVC